jgi:hypothetical protein
VDRADKVIERKTIHGNLFFDHPSDFEAVSSAHPGDGPMGFVSSRVTLFGPNCSVVFDQLFPDTIETRFTDARLGKTSILLLTTFYPGGSGCGYEQIILAYGKDEEGVRALTPMRLSHDNMDGVYVGELSRGKGPGLVFWSALWEDEAHYSPHRYKIVTYRWRDGKFIGPSTEVTKGKYPPGPDEVAARLGFSFRDQTRQDRFGGC